MHLLLPYLKIPICIHVNVLLSEVKIYSYPLDISQRILDTRPFSWRKIHKLARSVLESHQYPTSDKASIRLPEKVSGI